MSVAVGTMVEAGRLLGDQTGVPRQRAEHVPPRAPVCTLAEQVKCAHVLSLVTTKVRGWELYMERVAAGWRGAENPCERLAQTVVESVFM